MAYTRYHADWQNTPSTATPVTAESLEWMESGIVSASRAPGAIFVAASDAPDVVKASADIVCDGTADQAEINAAFTASHLAGSTQGFGAVELSAGTFYLTGPVLIPGRGAALYGQGIKTELRIDTTQSTFIANASGGQGTDKALIMFATTAEAQNAVNVFISKLSVNAGVWSGSQWTARGIGGIILDQSAGGSTTGTSYPTYGWPTSPTSGDTYHRVTDLYFWYVTYGVRFVGGGSTYSRGNNVANCRGGRVSVAGYSSSGASDCHFSQCHVIGSTAANAAGFLAGGGSTRMSGCKAAYFNDTGAIGFNVSSSRASMGDCEAQDCMNGVRVTGADARLTGVRVETQEDPCDIAVEISGNNCSATGLWIHTRGTGTWARGLNFDSTSDDHQVQALIDPTGITTSVSVGAGAEITSTANLPRGSYAIRVVGNPGTTLNK